MDVVSYVKIQFVVQDIKVSFKFQFLRSFRFQVWIIKIIICMDIYLFINISGSQCCEQ